MKERNGFYGKAIRKTLAVICLLCLLSSFGAVIAGAEGAVKITASSCTVERGDTASIAFSLEGNPGIWGIKLRIHYNHSALTLTSVTTGSVFDKGEFTMSASLDKDPYVVMACGNALENKTANGKIVTLDFEVNSNAAFESYAVTAEVSQVNNVDGDIITVTADDGSISVVDCKHAEKEWRVTLAAGCDTAGTETLTCKKCGDTFDTRAVNATGHLNTEIKDAVPATTTAEGYTGDTYCKDCGKKISEGTVIARLEDESSDTSDSSETSGDDEPEITSDKNMVFNKGSESPLVFVSSADFSKFVRVEIDGIPLAATDYTVESGSTVVTVSSAFLSTLGAGSHTLSIVSTSGTAEVQFTVQSESESSDTSSDTSSGTAASELSENASADTSVDTGDKSSSAPLIVAVVLLLLLVGGVAELLVIRKRRSL